jgi:hypothetical protein
MNASSALPPVGLKGRLVQPECIARESLGLVQPFPRAGVDDPLRQVPELDVLPLRRDP